MLTSIGPGDFFCLLKPKFSQRLTSPRLFVLGLLSQLSLIKPKWCSCFVFFQKMGRNAGGFQNGFLIWALDSSFELRSPNFLDLEFCLPRPLGLGCACRFIAQTMPPRI